MACGGCSKRRNALKEKIANALAEKEEAQKHKIELSPSAKKVLESNAMMASIVKRDQLVKLKSELMRSKSDIPSDIDEKIRLANLEIKENIVKSNSLRPNRRPVRSTSLPIEGSHENSTDSTNSIAVISSVTSNEDIKMGVEESVRTGKPPYVPPEFVSFVKMPEFDINAKYDILNERMSRRRARSIFRTERILRNVLLRSINGNGENVQDVAAQYSLAIFNLYLFYKKQYMT